MNENRSPIPSRLYNAAKGGHVTGAADIIDDDKGKTQDVINKETDSALENRYTKNETYNKTELNNLITTPEVNYVNVKATDQTTSISDVLPATGAANTIYKIGDWNGTQYDTSKYTEYTWNGSAYIPLATRDHGVDDEPTAGSDNLVKSGGVEKYITLPSVFDIPGGNDNYLFNYATKLGMSYLIFNNTNSNVTIRNCDNIGNEVWTMADQLSPNQTVVFTYPQSTTLSLSKIKIKTENSSTEGEIKIVQTQSAFSSLLLQEPVIKRVNSLSFDVGFKRGTIGTSGTNIGQVVANNLRCYCILGTVTKGNYLTYNIKSGYKIAIFEWDGIADTMSVSWYTEPNGTHKINENYIYVIVGKVGDGTITPIEANDAASVLYSEDLFPFIQNCYNNIDNLLPIIWQQGTNGTVPGTIAASDIRCISILNDTKSVIAYKVHSDYSIIISEWNDGDTTFYKPRSWFNGIGIYKAVKKNVAIVVKKNDESAISYSSITKDVVDIIISPKYNTAFECICEEGKEITKHNNFVQGTVQTSGTNIGQIIANPIRCVDVLDLPIGTGLSVIANPGYKVSLACYSDGDTNTTSAGFREGATTFRTFGTHAYLIVGKTNDSTITPNEAIENVAACSSENGNPILASINKLEEKDYNKIPYVGEALPFNKTMTIKEYKTIPNWVDSQAGTVYGDFLVVALAMDEVASGNPNGHLYNIKTGEHISSLTFGNTLDDKTYTMPHGNQICFGNKYYNENSVFPLLYVSQTTLYGDEANKGELGVLVYDIQKVSDSEYTPVLVQAIIPDLEDIDFRNKISKWTTNYVVDTDNNKLYLVGYPRMWDWSDIYNSTKGYYPISRFELPKLSDGDEVVLSASNLEENYEVYRETAVQMMLYYRGKIYIQGGFNGTNAPKYLDAVDLCNHSIVSQINLSSVRTLEPQGLFVYDNRLLWYDAGTSGKIDEFIF